MDISVGNRVKLKKAHPCGGNVFVVTRVGMDFKLKCETCGHEVMVPRAKAEKSIREIIKETIKDE